MSRVHPLAAHTSVQPRHHFSGELLESHAGCMHGLYQLSLTLLDDNRRRHVVYIAHGRGDAAAAACMAQWRELQIGRRYHGSATLRRLGDTMDFWMGNVQIEPCQRRRRFELVHGGLPC